MSSKSLLKNRNQEGIYMGFCYLKEEFCFDKTNSFFHLLYFFLKSHIKIKRQKIDDRLEIYYTNDKNFIYRNRLFEKLINY